jgi:hypothetical protein
MCQHKSIYTPSETPDEFTKWVRENALCNLFDKFITTEQPVEPLRSNNIIRAILAEDEEDSLILSTLFDTYIPPANLLPWSYRLIPPPYTLAVRTERTENTEGNENTDETT